MKTNFQSDIQDKIVVCFDLHDTLVYSTRAWKKAFKIVCKNDKGVAKKIIEEYNAGGWKRKICESYGYDYDEVKKIYFPFLKPIKSTKKFCLKMKEYHKVFIITNAKKTRAIEDSKILGINFDKIYSRDDGVKPDKEYIERILTENNIKYMIMVGNEECDKFPFKQIKIIEILPRITYNKLIKNYEKILKEFEEMEKNNNIEG